MAYFPYGAFLIEFDIKQIYQNASIMAECEDRGLLAWAVVEFCEFTITTCDRYIKIQNDSKKYVLLHQNAPNYIIRLGTSSNRFTYWREFESLDSLKWHAIDYLHSL